MNSLIRSSLFNCEKTVRYLRRQYDVWERIENQPGLRPSGTSSQLCFWSSQVAKWQHFNSEVGSVRDSHSVRSREVGWLTWSYSASCSTCGPTAQVHTSLLSITLQRHGPESRTLQAPFFTFIWRSYYLILTLFVRCYEDLLSVGKNTF